MPNLHPAMACGPFKAPWLSPTWISAPVKNPRELDKAPPGGIGGTVVGLPKPIKEPIT
jgi:hypothetical protein